MSNADGRSPTDLRFRNPLGPTQPTPTGSRNGRYIWDAADSTSKYDLESGHVVPSSHRPPVAVLDGPGGSIEFPIAKTLCKGVV
jgi:hypothetical protein